MRVVLIIAALLLVAAAGSVFVPETEPYRAQLQLPYTTLGLAVLVLILACIPSRRSPAAMPEPARPVVEPARPVLTPQAAARAEAEVVQLLAMFQEKGRLVDFLMDDINPYNDAQVGAAARVVHAGCKSVLTQCFQVTPVRTEAEGSTVQVPEGYAPDEYRLVGRITGAAPFSGVLVHRGWRTDTVNLPQLLQRAADRLPAIAPAEVEVK